MDVPAAAFRVQSAPVMEIIPEIPRCQQFSLSIQNHQSLPNSPRISENMEFISADLQKFSSSLTANNNNRMYNFNVNAPQNDEEVENCNNTKKNKTSRDPMSHRIIEKRRRDRMNACLADLSKLIPTTILKQGQGRIEKTEIIEMAIKHIKLLQSKLHEPVSEKSEVCLEEKKLQGYKECYNDTAGYMQQIGYNITDPVFHNMRDILDQHINKQKIKIAKIYEALAKQQQELQMTSCHYQQQLSQPHGQHSGSSSPESVDNMLENSSRSEGSPNSGSGDGVMYNNNNPSSMQEKENCNDIDNQQVPNNVEMVSEVNLDSGLGSGSNNTSSEMANSDFSGNSSSSNYMESKAYKYKNKIQERFSGLPGEEKKPDISKDFPPFGKNGITLEDLSGTTKPSSLTGTDFSSEFHGAIGSMKSMGRSSQSSPSNTSDDSRNERDSCSLNNTVPAFALHPMGVHYIPLVLPVSQVMPFMRNHKSMGICHPVSIPVSFTGPFLMGEPELGDCQSESGRRSASMRGKKHHSDKSMSGGSSGSDPESYHAKKNKKNK